ncbi:MAG: multidrug efflux SMR transporter [Burkholderiales bacterium]|nr:multidrug efflux SMR transporter [Burkholderiales bacterium]
MNWIYLFIAIIGELVGTSALKAAEGFTKIAPSILCICGYLVAFYFLSLTLKSIPLGIAYAIWSGFGIVLITMIGYFYYKQAVDLPAIIGISFIVLGVVIINVFSKTSMH